MRLGPVTGDKAYDAVTGAVCAKTDQATIPEPS